MDFEHSGCLSISLFLCIDCTGGEKRMKVVGQHLSQREELLCTLTLRPTVRQNRAQFCFSLCSGDCLLPQLLPAEPFSSTASSGSQCKKTRGETTKAASFRKKPKDKQAPSYVSAWTSCGLSDFQTARLFGESLTLLREERKAQQEYVGLWLNIIFVIQFF